MIDAIVKGSCAVLVVGHEAFLRMALTGNTVYWYKHNNDYESWVAINADDVDTFEQMYMERER